MLCSFIVMKIERFSQITDLVDFLNNNRIIAYYCGFDITHNLPSYWTFDRFIRKLDNNILKDIMSSQVLRLNLLGYIDADFIGLDSTPVMANTKHNNPKSFSKSKFLKSNPPKSDKDCKLGVHSASNQHNEKNFEYYWGYKNHVLVDCITGLPIYELTTGANVYDSTVALDILSRTNSFLPINQCSFLADKGYDAKAIYNTVKNTYCGDCFIPLNPRGSKNCNTLPCGNPICDAGFAMHKDGKTTDGNGGLRQKFCCPFRQSKNQSCPCDHKNWNNGKKNRGCTKYISLPYDYRLSIDRNCKNFKKIYAFRTECERYNSRFKQTGQERLWVRNMNSAQNLNTVAHISLLAVAIAAVVTRNSNAVRSSKALMRTG